MVAREVPSTALSRTQPARRVAYAPGRVNLVGDHTDYVGGLALPMAVSAGTTVDLRLGGSQVDLVSDAEELPARAELDGTCAPGSPPWSRYVGAVVAEVTPLAGATGTVSTTLPIGAGLSSSAALEVSLSLALGARGTPRDLALACQRAEHRATGVPSGVMDQLTVLCGEAGHALLMDFSTLDVTAVPVPYGAVVLVLHSGLTRRLGDTPYAERRREAESVVAEIGPLRDADVGDLAVLRDPLLRRRGRHVVTENDRVRRLACAFAAGDLAGAGAVMTDSHRSLRDDMQTSAPVVDDLVDALIARPGVYGARVTGAGFGGCVVALASTDVALGELPHWRFVPSGPAHVQLEE
jgi:galactokinase